MRVVLTTKARGELRKCLEKRDRNIVLASLQARSTQIQGGDPEIYPGEHKTVLDGIAEITSGRALPSCYSGLIPWLDVRMQYQVRDQYRTLGRDAGLEGEHLLEVHGLPITHASITWKYRHPQNIQRERTAEALDIIEFREA